ncbi:hypothetical protein MPK66_gp015 [Erwinia phage pEa_SNUABM_2]|uniref:Uncharacterized protein n=1 Tax=Erwinia phage pEa_SNUABM_2 TaxID=2869547 RepID=A0AAE8C1F4_9CAUD|nr:hypothetical protein MPK66_gp015 [Erwinia phage pEa_SNUABM_2]QZE59259.1 hypothetical protein pEaSNUABM2_00015 [Erwinia phage pEa_SNUABM_2]
MITAKNVESRLAKINYTRPDPSREELEELVSHGKTRILKTADINGLCPLSDKYFEFCLKQVGSFCTASYNAVEIAMCVGIQPIYVAAALHLYGSDWAYRLLKLKRFGHLDRGIHTVWESAGAWFSLGECRRRILGSQTVSQGQGNLKTAIRLGDMEQIRQIAAVYPHRVMSVLAARNGLLYTDQRIERSKRLRAEAKAKAEADGKKLAEPGKYNDLAPVFNGPIAKPDRTRGIDDSSQTRGTISGRRFHV